ADAFFSCLISDESRRDASSGRTWADYLFRPKLKSVSNMLVINFRNTKLVFCPNVPRRSPDAGSYHKF
ncbi:MAG: hypothetical protein ACYDEZ_04825, partial [Methanoregula sp.]